MLTNRVHLFAYGPLVNRYIQIDEFGRIPESHASLLADWRLVQCGDGLLDDIVYDPGCCVFGKVLELTAAELVASQRWKKGYTVEMQDGLLFFRRWSPLAADPPVLRSRSCWSLRKPLRRAFPLDNLTLRTLPAADAESRSKQNSSEGGHAKLRPGSAEFSDS